MRKAGDVQSGRLRPEGQLRLRSENVVGKDVFVFLWTGECCARWHKLSQQTSHERDARLG